MIDYVAYTDGSYRGNTGRGGYAAYNDTTGDLVYGTATNTTNNRMEIMAVLAILDTLPDGTGITIYSDSAYVVNSIACGWIHNWYNQGRLSPGKNSVKNVDLWIRVYSHLHRLSVNMIWVKGHADNPYNNLVDEVAGYQSSLKKKIK